MSGSPSDFPSLKPGGHVCLAYSKEEEKHDAIAGFIHDGLLRGERCLYWGTPAGFAALLPHLEARGVPVAELRERSALVLADTTAIDVDAFDPGKQAASFRHAVAIARSEGYGGLRVAGDPDERMRAALGHERLAAFETSLSELFGDVRATGLCVFDQRTTDPSTLEVAMTTHEVAVVSGQVCENPFFQAPGKVPGPLAGSDRATWMTAHILEAAKARELIEAENAALIVESSRASQREAAYRKHIATLTRSLEARDRLLITAARWLSRPLPAMCGQLGELTKDERLLRYQQGLDLCSEHLAAVTRLSRGLDEIASFLQLQVVLRPERLDLVEVARTAIADLKDDASLGDLQVVLEGAKQVTGSWDRMRLLRLFLSLIRTAREQGYDTRVHMRIDDLAQFARIRLEFLLPHAPALSDSGERARALAYGPAGESDYERLAVHTWSAREIVRLMGGALGISTWADARVVFTLDLPKTAPEAPADDASD
jgi:signal transduction histidine kinase